MTTRIAIAGAGGRMGRALLQSVSSNPEAALVAAVVRSDSTLIGADAGEMCGTGKTGVKITDRLEACMEHFDVLIVNPIFDGMNLIAKEAPLVNERTRELGLLRAVGMTRKQLRSSVRWEAAIIALVGTFLGLLLALGLSFTLARGLRTQGLAVYSVPVNQLVVIVVLFALLGVVASVLPARRAARLKILDAIATD